MYTLALAIRCRRQDLELPEPSLDTNAHAAAADAVLNWWRTHRDPRTDDATSLDDLANDLAQHDLDHRAFGATTNET